MKCSFEKYQQAAARIKRVAPEDEMQVYIDSLRLTEAQIEDLQKHACVLSLKIGRLIKALRGTKHLQNTLARKAGISQSALSKLEKGYPDAPAIPSSVARKLYNLLKL